MPVLKRLLPVILDTAMSGDPIRRAANEVATSGKEVERAMSRLPMKLALNPVSNPMFSPAMDSPMLARAISAVEIAYKPMACARDGRELSGCVWRERSPCGSALCSSQSRDAYIMISMLVAMDPRGAGNSVSDCSDAKSKIPTRINMPEKTNDSFVGPEIDERSDGPRIVSSIIPMISKLNILLPKTVPMARSGASVSVTALMPVKISGREVAVASITAPRNPLLKPV